MLNIATIVGARPQFIKAAVISRLIRSEAYRGSIREYLVHTGQHYDEGMSEVFFREMRIPNPDVNLGIGGSTHGAMTGRMIERIERVIQAEVPDLVLVYGDTDSTLAGAIAAAKMHVPIAHVEAGLRSYSKAMPEEINRVLADHASAYLFCPTPVAVDNLKKEGILSATSTDVYRPSNDKPLVLNVGDIMLDASLYYHDVALARPQGERAIARLGLRTPFRLFTLHRAENTDSRERMTSIFSALGRADKVEIVFPVHPRTRKFLTDYGISLPAHVHAIEPVGYLDMVELEDACQMIITDSGGLQKEAVFHRKPCVTLRDQTEWVETVDTGWNVLVGADSDEIVESLRSPRPGRPADALYGNGDTGERIIAALLTYTSHVDTGAELR